jgi:hypothetical protein
MDIDPDYGITQTHDPEAHHARTVCVFDVTLRFHPSLRVVTIRMRAPSEEAARAGVTETLAEARRGQAPPPATAASPEDDEFLETRLIAVGACVPLDEDPDNPKPLYYHVYEWLPPELSLYTQHS